MTINSSCSRLNAPVNGRSPVLTTMPSLTHCQNCVCVVQYCLRSRQMTSAVFFLFFLFALIGPIFVCPPKVIQAHLCSGLFPLCSKNQRSGSRETPRDGGS